MFHRSADTTIRRHACGRAVFSNSSRSRGQFGCGRVRNAGAAGRYKSGTQESLLSGERSDLSGSSGLEAAGVELQRTLDPSTLTGKSSRSNPSESLKSLDAGTKQVHEKPIVSGRTTVSKERQSSHCESSRRATRVAGSGRRGFVERHLFPEEQVLRRQRCPGGQSQPDQAMRSRNRQRTVQRKEGRRLDRSGSAAVPVTRWNVWPVQINGQM